MVVIELDRSTPATCAYLGISFVSQSIMNHGSGSYVGMTQKKHGRPYIRADRIFAENSLPVHFGASKTAYLTSTTVFR